MTFALPYVETLGEQSAESTRALLIQLARQLAVSHTADEQRHREIVRAYHSTTQSLPDATWTAVTFNSEDDLRDVLPITTPEGVHSKTVRADRFVMPGFDRRYVRGSVRVNFLVNAAGSRGIYLTRNDAIASILMFVPAATASGGTFLSAPFSLMVDPQDVLQVFAYQSSGGPLNIGSAIRAQANEIELEFC